MAFRDIEIDKLLTAGKLAEGPKEAGHRRSAPQRERRPVSGHSDGAAREPPRLLITPGRARLFTRWRSG